MSIYARITLLETESFSFQRCWWYFEFNCEIYVLLKLLEFSDFSQNHMLVLLHTKKTSILLQELIDKECIAAGSCEEIMS